MATTELLPNLHLLTPGGWQVYVWRDEDGITLIDAGAADSAPDLRADLAELSLAIRDVDRLVLTHFHDDHAGGAAELAGGEIEVLAHAQDALIIRGEQAGAPPNFTDAERKLHAQVARALPPAPPCRIDREVVDGEVLDIAGGALVVATPGLLSQMKETHDRPPPRPQPHRTRSCWSGSRRRWHRHAGRRGGGRRQGRATRATGGPEGLRLDR